MVVAIIDGDPIVYRAGFAGESHERHVVWSPADSDDIEQIILYPMEGKTSFKQLQEWMATFPEDAQPVILENDTVVVPEPLENVLHTVKVILRDTTYAIAEQLCCKVDDVKTVVLLSGPDNFRYKLATVAPYKGNRKDTAKPYWYQQIRNYLTDQWDAEVIEGREADDECSILQLRFAADGKKSIICSIDKDLDMVPGSHYDYVRRTFYYTTGPEGQALFYKQILSGDGTDNIPGAFRIGGARAAAIVDGYLLDNPGDYAGLWQRVVEAYAETLEKYGDTCPYFEKASAEGIEAVALEMARLVKMQEYPGQLWNPPGTPDELIETTKDEGYE